MLKPGDLIRVQKENSGWGGKIGIVIAHPVEHPDCGCEPFEATSVLLESSILIPWISTDWLDKIYETD